MSAALALLLGAAQKDTQKDCRAEAELQAAINKETVEGDLKGAIELYLRLADGGDHAVAATALVRMGQCYERLGSAEARKAYERVVREFSDQKEKVAEARIRLAALARSTGAPGGPTLTVRRILAGDVSGQVSPDGHFLSFTDWGASGNLAIRDLATGQSRRLTDEGSLIGSEEFAEESVPSPDSRSVAYAWFGATYELRVVGLDGSKPRVLRAGGDGVVRQFPLAWSPDSRHVLAEVVKADGTRDMMLVAVADGSAKLLKAMGKDPSPGGVFSPDGRYVAWVTKEGLSLFDLQTGTESPLVPDRTNPCVLGWAPDGRHILFSSERSGSADAWLIAVADGKVQGEPMFVKKDLGRHPMGFTSMGAFYYAVNNVVGDVKIVEIDPVSGNVVSPLQSASRRGNTWSPDWSPDGRFLAYILARESGRTVIVCSLETGEEREFEVGERTIGIGASLHWLPDGKAVAVPTSEPGKGDSLVRIDVQTGRITTLMPFKTEYGFPRFDFSPDGNTVFYVKLASSGGNVNRVVARDLKSGQEVDIIEKPGLNRGIVSPDGRRLLIGVNDNGTQILFVIPVAGGEVRELLRLGREKEVPFWGAPWWTPDGRYIAFLKGAKGEAQIPNKSSRIWQLWRISAEGGEPQRLGLTVGRQMGGLRPHPDGRRLATTDFSANLEVWVMENFLPPAKVAK